MADQAPSRFQHRPQMFVGVPSPTWVCIGIEKREDFDRIAAPVTDHGENENGHVLTKTIGQRIDDRTVEVTFQYWLKSLTSEALIADMRRRRAERQASERQAS